MKKIFINICSVILILTLILCTAHMVGSASEKAPTAQANSNCKLYRDAFSVGGGFGTWWAYNECTWTGDETVEGICIVDYHGPYDSEIVVPDYIDDRPVIRIDNILNNCYYKKEKQNAITKITLPSTLKEISANAFSNMTALKTVVIPEGLEIIGDYAFKWCGSLTTVNLPDSLRIIGEDPFYGCGGITKITSSKLPSSLETIGPSAFSGFTGLTSVEFPASLKTIDESAFYGCSNLSEVIFNEGLTNIGNYAFAYCNLKNIEFNNGLESIGEYAFAYNKNLTQVSFSEGIKEIGKYAFYDCNLENVELKDGLETINDYAFANNANLKIITLSETVTHIGKGFIYGSAVEELILPDSLKSAGKFLDGTIIKEIVLPANFAKLNSGMLVSGTTLENLETLTVQDTDVEKIPFSNLKTFIFKGKGEISENPFYTETVTVGGVKTTTVYPPETFIFTDAVNENVHKILIDEFNYYLRIDPETGYYVYSKEYSGEEEFRPLGNSFTSGDYTYDTTAGGGAVITAYNGTETGVLTVPDSFENEGVSYPVVTIGQKAFMESTATEIVLPESVKNIEAFAFYNNDNLTKTNLPEGIKVVEPYTYGACNSITEITIPESVVYIGDLAFSGSDVTELVIPSSVKTIGRKAFFSTPGLNSLTLNEGLEKIGERAFANGQHYISGTTFGGYSLTLPSSIKEIGEGTFEYSRVGGEVVIPESITKIPDSMFNGCETITSVVMHSGITEIGNDAFARCDNLTSAPLLSGLEKVGDFAFFASGLTSITIPTTVTSLGEYAFGDTQITAITVPANIKTIPRYCFYGCYSLKNVTIANGVEYIKAYAFSNSGSYDRIVLPPSILDISDYVFQDVEKIENFVFNVTCYESDLEIDYDNDEYPRFGWLFYSPFYDNVQIGKLIVGGNVKYIPEGFAYGAIIEEVVLPNNIVAIGENAFEDCIIEKPLVIPNSVKTICEFAFWYTTVSEITLPETLETIEDDAFEDFVAETVYYNCKNCVFELRPEKTEIEGIYESPFSRSEITNFVIGENVQTLPDFVFCKVYNLETVHIPDNITSLSKGAFAFSGVKKVTGMSSITKIEDYTFYKCKDLTLLDVGNAQITKAGKYAFAYSGIENLSGLESLTQIKDYAFYECKNLKDVDLTDSKVSDIGIFAFANSSLTSFSATNILESVGESSFNNCVNLVNLDLGTKIMLIGDNAFEGCTALKNLVVPDTVKDVGNRAFAECPALETVYMSVNVDFIPTECFYNDTSLSSFTWEATSKLIGRLAFGNCTGLNNFNFIGIEKLYESSFYNSGVKVVTLGEALDEANALLEEIQTSTFQNCLELQTISIGGNVDTVSNLAFAGCANLEVAIISDNVTDIADDAFEDCPNLTFVCSETSYAYAYASENGIPVSTLVIAPIPNQTYTGNYIRPELKVTFSNSSLTNGIDFTVSYSNNKNVGQATVKVNGRGAYEMLASKATFTIVTRSITKAKISEIKNQRYTSNPIEPSITITDNGRYLKEGKDYKVSYYDNVNHGKAYVSVVGKGNYSGSVQTTFVIDELGSGAEVQNWFESFLRDLFAQFLSIFLILGFKIR